MYILFFFYKDWLIVFHMSACPILYFVKRLGNNLLCTFIFTFLCRHIFSDFLKSILNLFCFRSYRIRIILNYILDLFDPKWDPLEYYHSESEWVWEKLQWKGTPHCRDYRNWILTILNSLVSYPTHHLFWSRVLFYSARYSQRILLPVNSAILIEYFQLIFTHSGDYK